MSGVICGKCFNSTNEPRHPVCERDDCPGKETFMRFDNAVANELMDAASNDAERAIQRAEKAEHDLKCLQESTVDRKAYARLRAERNEAWAANEKHIEVVAAKEAEIARLREALEPFAALASVLDERGMHDKNPTHVSLCIPDAGPPDYDDLILTGEVEDSQMILGASADARGTPATFCFYLKLGDFRRARAAAGKEE